MNILAIETSCDETAVSLVRAEGDFPTASYEIAGNALHSQIDLHRQYGGVFPSLAKREHAKRLVPLLETVLKEADLLRVSNEAITDSITKSVTEYLSRETNLAEELLTLCRNIERPDIDLIAVTNGPGLEPALWVGVSFAKALATLWDYPVVPVDHMEGHILASLYDATEDNVLAPIEFPAVALLISGGHTELVLMRDWNQYEKIGQTRDDAVGEAFDKVARLLGLPYPGGPEISRLAAMARGKNLPAFSEKPLPRPMLNSPDLSFSFSGLKTAVRYVVAKRTLGEDDVSAVARDFEDAVIEVLTEKSRRAIKETNAKTLIIGGGVSANRQLRQVFKKELAPSVEIFFPRPELSTDNSVMIALAGHAHANEVGSATAIKYLRADGNRSL